jgi:carboxymethylenebutenolidase
MKLGRSILLILLGLLALAALLIIALAGIIAFDALVPAQRVTDFSNVTYPGPGSETLYGYLAKPAGAGPSPTILLIHEFFGLNEDVIKKADLLADQGYTVLAADAYRGRSTQLIPRAIWLRVTTPQEQIDADLDAAYQYLSQLPEADPNRLAVVGFCFGGTQAMRLGIRNPDLAANVILYGSGLVLEPADMGNLGQKGPVLGIFGEEDRSIPLSDVYAFEDAMQTKGILHRITVYPGVGHAFVKYDNLLTPGPAQDAWNEVLTFLEEILKS